MLCADNKVRQLATALYFIDTLALRVGNEKDPELTAETVGCTSLHRGHVKVRKYGNIELSGLTITTVIHAG